MAISKAASDSLNGVKPLSGRTGGGMAPMNGLHVPPNLREFVHSDMFMTFALDPAKSVTPDVIVAKLYFHAKRMAPERDGIRRSRAVWVSNTEERLGEIEGAFLKELPGSIPDRETGRDHTFTAPFGDDVECEVLFRVYNKNEDVSAMPHASFYIFDELIGVNGEVLTMATSRVGLYPDKRNGPGCVTEDGKKNKIVWGVSSTPNGDASYWDDLITNNDGFVHVTRLP